MFPMLALLERVFHVLCMIVSKLVGGVIPPPTLLVVMEGRAEQVGRIPAPGGRQFRLLCVSQHIIISRSLVV